MNSNWIMHNYTYTNPDEECEKRNRWSIFCQTVAKCQLPATWCYTKEDDYVKLSVQPIRSTTKPVRFSKQSSCFVVPVNTFFSHRTSVPDFIVATLIQLGGPAATRGNDPTCNFVPQQPWWWWRLRWWESDDHIVRAVWQSRFADRIDRLSQMISVEFVRPTFGDNQSNLRCISQKRKRSSMASMAPNQVRVMRSALVSNASGPVAVPKRKIKGITK